MLSAVLVSTFAPLVTAFYFMIKPMRKTTRKCEYGMPVIMLHTHEWEVEQIRGLILSSDLKIDLIVNSTIFISITAFMLVLDVVVV